MDSDGADKIVQAIVGVADTQVEEILQEAKKNAGEVRLDAEKRAQSERQVILMKGQQLADRERQRVLADAKIRVKREIFEVKEDLIKKAFADADVRLAELADTSEYSDILNKLIVESGAVAGGGSLEVLVRGKDTGLLSEEILAGLSEEISRVVDKTTALRLSGETIATVGGCVLRNESGTIEVDNTFESRISRLRSELRFKVAEILFGGAS